MTCPAPVSSLSSRLRALRRSMSRSVIVKWFYASLISLGGGLILLSGAAVLALTADILVMDGPDVVGVRSAAPAWILSGLLALAIAVLLGSGVAMFVAWIGAVVNTAGLPAKAWFVILLVAGLLGMAAFAMVAYVAAGPGGSQSAALPGGEKAAQPSGHDVSAPPATHST